MPDARLARTRATLPPDYQFGDARLYHAERRWRALHENAGEELRRKAVWGGPCPGCATYAECVAFGRNCQRDLAEQLRVPAAVDPHVSDPGTLTTRENSSSAHFHDGRYNVQLDALVCYCGATLSAPAVRNGDGWNVIEGDPDSH